MEFQTIGQVSKKHGISLRMLRYYEKAGLLESKRKDDYAYRVYDESALRRLRQIIFLRKLRIPVKQIKAIVSDQDATAAIEVFQQSISELDEEITALSTIKKILRHLIDELQQRVSIEINLDMLADSSMLSLIDALSFTKYQIKESLSMDALSKATEVVNKLRNVRIIYLPPMTVASVCFAGVNPQEEEWQAVTDFVKQSNLLEIKPDLRVFRVEYAHVHDGNNYGGYEMWVSIPDKLHVPAPLVKKRFLGGQYAAHVMGDNSYETWLGLQDWVNESDKYQYDVGLGRCESQIKDDSDSFVGMRLDLEEVLNFYNDQISGSENQLDLLLPIKKYEMSEEVPAEIPGSKEKCGFQTSIVTKNKFRIIGFTKIITWARNDIDQFENKLKTDGRLALLNQYRKPGAPILGCGSVDMDSLMKGGWRWSICLAESDVIDVPALMEHPLYVEWIDASRWLIIEHAKGEPFDDHGTCKKLGYIGNSVVDVSIIALPDGKIGKPTPDDEADMKSIVYCWYPVM